jgi:TATA-box binding protein (TBP) (component of TFIID and TFIIIB)
MSSASSLLASILKPRILSRVSTMRAATIAFQKGHIIVDFAREADALEDAIATAVEAVTKAGAKVDRVEPDPLVSLLIWQAAPA